MGACGGNVQRIVGPALTISRQARVPAVQEPEKQGDRVEGLGNCVLGILDFLASCHASVYIHCMSTTQRYKVKRHKGTRIRAMVALTLAENEIRALDRLAKCRGLTRSRLVGQLALAVKP